MKFSPELQAEIVVALGLLILAVITALKLRLDSWISEQRLENAKRDAERKQLLENTSRKRGDYAEDRPEE